MSKFFPVKLVFAFTHILCFSKSKVCSEVTMEGPIGSDGMADLSRLPENFGIIYEGGYLSDPLRVGSIG